MAASSARASACGATRGAAAPPGASRRGRSAHRSPRAIAGGRGRARLLRGNMRGNRPSRPTLPEMRDAITGTPMRSASHTTLAPPSMRELITIAWLVASQRKRVRGQPTASGSADRRLGVSAGSRAAPRCTTSIGAEVSGNACTMRSGSFSARRCPITQTRNPRATGRWRRRVDELCTTTRTFARNRTGSSRGPRLQDDQALCELQRLASLCGLMDVAIDVGTCQGDDQWFDAREGLDRRVAARV